MTTYTYDGANQLTTEKSAARTTTYSYDASGNRSKKDAPAGITFYTWNEEQRLTEADPPGNAATFEYNAHGRRVTTSVGMTTQNFIYDFRHLLQETDAAGATELPYTYTTEEYGSLVRARVKGKSEGPSTRW